MLATFAAAALVLASPPASAPREVTLGDGAGALYGTLLPGAEAAPAVLILAGSGPTDRDGNAAPAIRANTLRLLAEGLAARGVTTLRVDKRGVGASKPAMASEASTTIDTMAADARAWAARLRKDTGARCVWLLGHSEGGLVALLAARDNQDVCGLVLVAAPGRRFGDLLRQQFAAAYPEPLRTEALAALATMESGGTVAAPSPPLAPLFRPSVQPFLASLLRVDPAALVRDDRRPILVVQGDTDIQVTGEDARRLASARDGVRLVTLPGVNHVLKAAPADRAANIATYSDPALPLAAGVVEAVADLVSAKKPPR